MFLLLSGTTTRVLTCLGVGVGMLGLALTTSNFHESGLASLGLASSKLFRTSATAASLEELEVQGVLCCMGGGPVMVFLVADDDDHDDDDDDGDAMNVGLPVPGGDKGSLEAKLLMGKSSRSEGSAS